MRLEMSKCCPLNNSDKAPYNKFSQFPNIWFKSGKPFAIVTAAYPQPKVYTHPQFSRFISHSFLYSLLSDPHTNSLVFSHCWWHRAVVGQWCGGTATTFCPHVFIFKSHSDLLTVNCHIITKQVVSKVKYNLLIILVYMRRGRLLFYVLNISYASLIQYLKIIIQRVRKRF